jgi:hypothetical protein
MKFIDLLPSELLPAELPTETVQTGTLIIASIRENFNYYGSAIMNGLFIFNIHESEESLFRELFDQLSNQLFGTSAREYKFDIQITDGYLKGCFVKSIDWYSNNKKWYRITINYDCYKKRSTEYEKVIDPCILTNTFVPLHSTAKIFDYDEYILNEIMKELDLWLTNFEEYYDRKQKGLIKYL